MLCFFSKRSKAYICRSTSISKNYFTTLNLEPNKMITPLLLTGLFEEISRESLRDETFLERNTLELCVYCRKLFTFRILCNP